MFTLAQIIVWLGIPLLFASMIAHMVRLPQYTKRIAAVVYVVVFVTIGFFPLADAFRPGIDLSGGTILVYQVKRPTPDGFDINEMVSAIHRRINPAGLMDVTIRSVGTDRVEIIIPRAKQEDVARCKRILTSVGNLEFLILANRRDHAALIEEAEASYPRDLIIRGKVAARWLPVAKTAEPITAYGKIALQRNRDHGEMVLAVVDDYKVTGEFLRHSEFTFDEMGRPAVGFHFGSEGARRFGILTEMNMPESDGFERRLAIVLDGKVYSAPGLRDRISNNGIITGDFSKEETVDLAAVLNAGSLPASLESTPASELTIGPTLGRDTIESGMTAMVVSTIVVLLFMAFYYRLAGIIADIAVVINVLIVVGTMSWVHATWTLSGLAGLALSVGMAVDANVLIFERLREEQARNRPLRQSIAYAFDRALRPILDSNVTTLLACAILYWIGSEQVKGFALTLLIGLLANLFTAVFVCRLVFDILERNAWTKRFGMFRLLGETNFNFVGKRWIAMAGSCLLIAMGMTALVLRGNSLFDIDFTGGTLAAVTFKKPVDPAEVRCSAAEALPDVSVEELQIRGESPGRRFLIRTTLQDQEAVKSALLTQLGNELVANNGAKTDCRETVFERMDNFGGQVAHQAQAAALVALLVSMGAIIVYLWIRFQSVLFGLGAVVALVHDVLIVLGLVAASRWLAGTPPGDWLGLESFKINLPMVAALLTLVGYSVNDTIVVFDRIREIRRKTQPITWEMINAATNQTLSRTLLTGLTTWIVALILYVFGGVAIHGFAFCLVAGVLVGTYSSIYIASPVLIWFGRSFSEKPRSVTPKAPKSDVVRSLRPISVLGRLPIFSRAGKIPRQVLFGFVYKITQDNNKIRALKTHG
ncbi:MAG: protein translocase subunit SecD [Pirellulales bacterium]|nr:protein translocase subunit SecD [Pirellulales bacterium]